MKNRAGILVALLLVLSFSSLIFAQKTSRPIRFARGRTTAVIRDTILDGQWHDYTLRARQGQTMSVHISGSSRNLTFRVIPPNGDDQHGSLTGEEGVRDWQGELPETGEYYISVHGPNRKATYTLEVNIR